MATSDHQAEAFDPRFPDVWDTWEALHHPNQNSRPVYTARGAATDFWHRYTEDLDLARSLGCTAFRFSISWSRVEPRPGQFSEDALRHYCDLADAIRARGMEPVITLVHFVWPSHVEERGGLRATEFPEWFGRYATKVCEAIGTRARFWITFNEPNALIFGYMKPFWMEHYAWPPGLPASANHDESMRATGEVIRNLFLANRAGRSALRDGPGGEDRLVSANSYYLGLPSHLWRIPLPFMRWVDWRARSEKGWAEEDWIAREGRIIDRPPGASKAIEGADWVSRAGLPRFAARSLDALFAPARSFGALFSFAASNWWQLGMRGDLPEFLCPRECRDELDFVAFDYYFGTQFLHRAGDLLKVLERRYHEAPIWPGGLYDALKYFDGMFPNKPIFVIENGVPGSPGDLARARYLRRHIREVQKARSDGVDVIGYLAWSLTTNREWGLPSGPVGDFGLYHIDLDGDPELKRHPTPAAHVYADIIRSRSA